MTAALEGVNADVSVRCLLILASLTTDELLARIDQEAKIFGERQSSARLSLPIKSSGRIGDEGRRGEDSHNASFSSARWVRARL